MSRAHHFHEPMIQEMQQATPIRGFQVEIGGVYVLMDDMITAIRQYADSIDNEWDNYDVGRPMPREILYELAAWLQSGERQLPELPTAAVEPAPKDVYVPNDLVDRVEIYPDDPMALRPKWSARGCDAEGNILYVTSGSFDQDYVILNAEQRWPGKPVHLLTEAGIDTVWEETDPGGIRSASSGRRRPSPRRLFG